MTTDKIKRLIAEASEGPWRADGPPWNRIIWRDGENRVCFMAHSNGLDDAKDIATSELIAAAPDLAARVVRLTEALERTREWLERLRLHGGDGAFAMSLLVDGKFGPRITETQLIAEISAALGDLK